MPPDVAVAAQDVRYRYGAREALCGVSFEVAAGEIFGVVGPNGGGKTTLFRILCTSIAPSGGSARVFGFDVVQQAQQVRRAIGVIFQAPSLDKKLTAAENLMHHGHLYGLSGVALRQRIQEMLDRVGLSDRAHDRIERLSGGMQRRVEVAKGVLHRPRLMIMDEPSTGLDPGARRDLWHYLRQLRDRDGLTILITTHLMDEADWCDRVAVLDRGSLVALGAPSELSRQLGGEIISLQANDPARLAQRITSDLGLACTVVDNCVRIEQDRGCELVPRLFESYSGEIQAITVRRPSLDDLFVRRTPLRSA